MRVNWLIFTKHRKKWIWWRISDCTETKVLVVLEIGLDLSWKKSNRRCVKSLKITVWTWQLQLICMLQINQLTNYAIIKYFFGHFLLTNVTKKWPFYNVTFTRNSNVSKYNVILTSLKNVTPSNKQIT